MEIRPSPVAGFPDDGIGGFGTLRGSVLKLPGAPDGMLATAKIAAIVVVRLEPCDHVKGSEVPSTALWWRTSLATG